MSLIDLVQRSEFPLAKIYKFPEFSLRFLYEDSLMTM